METNKPNIYQDGATTTERKECHQMTLKHSVLTVHLRWDIFLGTEINLKEILNYINDRIVSSKLILVF